MMLMIFRTNRQYYVREKDLSTFRKSSSWIGGFWYVPDGIYTNNYRLTII